MKCVEIIFKDESERKRKREQLKQRKSKYKIDD
jgi:hypothetical protein